MRGSFNNTKRFSCLHISFSNIISPHETILEYAAHLCISKNIKIIHISSLTKRKTHMFSFVCYRHMLQHVSNSTIFNNADSDRMKTHLKEIK